MDAEAFIRTTVDEHNEVVRDREFGAYVREKFALPNCVVSFKHTAEGLDKCVVLWRHLLPTKTGETIPRRVTQRISKIEDGRVHSVRAVTGGGASRPGDPETGGGPRTLWGLQQTQFNDKGLITELVIAGAATEPQVDYDEGAADSELGKHFMKFEQTFIEYFKSGDLDLLVPWCDPTITMHIDDTFSGHAVMIPFNRLPPTITFEYRGAEERDGRVYGDIFIWNWGGLDMPCTWDMKVTEDGKILEHLISIDV